MVPAHMKMQHSFEDGQMTSVEICWGVFSNQVLLIRLAYKEDEGRLRVLMQEMLKLHSGLESLKRVRAKLKPVPASALELQKEECLFSANHNAQFNSSRPAGTTSFFILFFKSFL